MLGDADELVGGVTEDGVVKTRLGVGVALGWEEADKVADAAAPGAFAKVPHPVNAIIKRIIRPFRRLRIVFATSLTLVLKCDHYYFTIFDNEEFGRRGGPVLAEK